jgi:actin-related protein 8
VVLVVPDFYDRAYVRELINVLLVTMGFKQVCAQQESVVVGIAHLCNDNVGLL